MTKTTLSGTSVWRPQSRYTVSRMECRNQRCRAKISLHPPKSRRRTFLQTPPSHFPLIRSRQGAKGGVSRRAGGGYRSTFGFRERIALPGGVAATVTPLVTRPKYPPPYRETGVAIPLSHCFLWYRRLSLLHPHFFLKNGLSQSEDRPNNGGIAEKTYRVIGGVARNSIANRAIVGH